MALTDMKPAVQEFNAKTLPVLADQLDQLRLEVRRLSADLHALLDRINGAKVTISINLQERQHDSKTSIPGNHR